MFSFHILLNAVIIIFILHIIIQNYSGHFVIGKPKSQTEHFGRQLGVPDKDEMNKYDYQKTLQFLEDDSDDTKVKENKDDDFKKKLISFIESPVQNKNIQEKHFEDKNMYPVLPFNSYTGNENVPNFESNVLNIQKFYNIQPDDSSPLSNQPNFDNLDESKLVRTTNENFSNQRPNTVIKNTPIPNLSNDVNDKSSYGRIATENPPTWNYKDELPMNGGVMGNIIGFDSLESQFSLYSPGVLNMQEANSPNFRVIPHDDLRKPIVYEN
jgi:hypothetical protein